MALFQLCLTSKRKKRYVFDLFQSDLLTGSQKTFDIKIWEQYLLEWLVACDMPFDGVDRPEFCTFVAYTHVRAAPLPVPSATTVKQRVMEMGRQLEEDMKTFVKVRVCPGFTTLHVVILL